MNTYTASLSVASTRQGVGRREALEVKPGDNDIIVRTVVRTPNRQPIPVDYRMTRTPSGWKVYDVDRREPEPRHQLPQLVRFGNRRARASTAS